MLRRWFALSALVTLAAVVGCGMCQDCQDYTGPVVESPNFGAYYDSPRVGSAAGGAPVVTDTVTPQMQPVPATAGGYPPAQGSTSR